MDIKLGDISDYQNVGDWSYILLAILIIDLIVLFMTKYLPDFLGKNLNIWYEKFGLSAVLSDVFIIAIGFALARYAYKYFYPFPNEPFHIGAFLGILVAVQALHDILFYAGVILPIPAGHNRMMDIFKDYSKAGGIIVVSDALMMLGSAVLAMIFKEMPSHLVVFTGLLSVYTLPYILETTNKYSLD
jgi:hypothetical protein